MSRSNVKQVSGKRRRTRGRTNLFLGKQYYHTYRIQERELSFKEDQFFLYWSSTWLLVRNGFWEIPLDWRCFLSRESVFMMMWACPSRRDMSWLDRLNHDRLVVGLCAQHPSVNSSGHHQIPVHCHGISQNPTCVVERKCLALSLSILLVVWSHS
jgi:hypothetical protein